MADDLRNDSEKEGISRPYITLIMKVGAEAGTVYPMFKKEMRIGRATNNDIVLVDPQSSRYHTLLRVHEDTVTIEDMGSTNGTMVNGRRISEPHVLQPADTFNIGGTVFGIYDMEAPKTVIDMKPIRTEPLPQKPPSRQHTPPPVSPAYARETVYERHPARKTTGSPKVWVFVAAMVAVLLVAVIAVGAVLLFTDYSPMRQPSIPEVRIQFPYAGSQLEVGQQVNIQAVATDPDGVIRMEVWANGELVGSSLSATSKGQPTFSASVPWTPSAPGSYTLEIRAYNSKGTSSAPTTLSVNVVGDAISSPTPTPTPESEEPTPTPEPLANTPIPPGVPKARATDNLNLRSGPGTEYEVVGYMPSGSEAEIIGRNEEGTWWQVVFAGAQAWVIGDYVETSNTENVPAVGTPSPPESKDEDKVPPAIHYFEAVPSGTIAPGKKVKLRWDFSGAEKATLRYDGVEEEVTAPAEKEVSPTETTTYKLIVTGKEEQLEKALTVNVEAFTMAGHWETNLGPLDLTQEENSVIGTYTDVELGEDVELSGVIKANQYLGFVEMKGQRMPFSLWVTADGGSFVGSYTDTSDDDLEMKEWCGARSGALPSPCLAMNFSGHWETNIGPLNVAQDAFDVSGTYTHDELNESGTISGKLDEDTVSGKWVLKGSTGDFTVWLEADGNTFRGNYGGGEAWCGARSGFSLPVECLRQ